MANEAPTIETQTEQPVVSLSLLASEKFPNEFKGEVKQPEPAKEEGEESEQHAEEQQAEQNTETEVEQESSTESTEESEETADGEQNISSFSELVENQGWDPDWANSLEVPIKVDGQESKVKLSDLTASYQTQAAATKNLNEAKEVGRTQNQVLAQKNEQVIHGLAQTAALIERAEKLLEIDKSSIDPNLRNTDPAEWSAKDTEMKNRQTEINQLKNDAIVQYNSTAQVGQAEQTEAMQQHLAQESEKLLTVVTEWKDPEVAKKGKQKLSEYLVTSGFPQEELTMVSDHRMIILARKAMLYDEGQTKTKTASKKVVKIPKVAKPGAQKPTDQVNQEKYDQAKARLHKTGKLEDAREVFRARNLLG